MKKKYELITLTQLFRVITRIGVDTKGERKVTVESAPIPGVFKETAMPGNIITDPIDGTKYIYGG